MKASITRSEFLKLSGAAALTLPMLELSAFADLNVPYASHPGVQVYTVMGPYKKDPLGTLKKIAAIGYKELEFPNPHDFLPHAKEVRDQGLTAISSHCSSAYLTGKWEKPVAMGHPAPTKPFEAVMEDCAREGMKYIGVPMIDKEDRPDLDAFKRFAAMLNKAGEQAKRAGIQFFYHNHSFEFEPMQGTTPFDIMLKEMDPNLVKIELDIFWITVSGNVPAQWINKLKGRVKMLHVKDLMKGTPIDYTTSDVARNNKGAFLPVGDGVVDIKGALKAAHEAGVEYTFVEQDYSALDPIESITRSYNYIKKLGL